MTLISSIQSLTLDLPPSCIAFCPTQPQYFVVGTYYLHPKALEDASTDLSGTEQTAQKRTGSLVLFRLDSETITQIDTGQTKYAILDIRWTPHSQQFGTLLAVATSRGSIAYYKLNVEHNDVHIHCVSELAVAEPSVLVLSIAWHPDHADVIGATLSNGEVNLYRPRDGSLWDKNAIIESETLHSHKLEAWTVAFHENDGIKILSGGDDMYLNCSSIEDRSSDSTLLWQNHRLHQAGVTAILPLTNDLVVTGSYDDHIRLISIPIGGRPQVRAEKNLGGGVWQLKLLHLAGLDGSTEHDLSYVILASCMHAGSCVLRLCQDTSRQWGFNIIAQFTEHRSMNYGSDVQPGSGTLKSIVSTSFYDKLLCLWQVAVGDVWI